MIVVNIALSSPSFNHLMGTLKPQSNGQLYNNTAIGTLAVDGWAVTFGTARSGLGGLGPHPVPSSLYQIKSRPPTASVPTSYYPTITLPVPIKWLRSITMSHTTVYVVPSSTQLMPWPRAAATAAARCLLHPADDAKRTWYTHYPLLPAAGSFFGCNMWICPSVRLWVDS